MIQIQFLALESLVAILADMLITLEYVLTGKLHIFYGEFIVELKQNDAGNPDLHSDCTNDVFSRIVLVEFHPIREAEGEKVTTFVLVHNLCMFGIKE